MPGKESRSLAFERSDAISIRRFPKWRFNFDLFDVREPRHLIQPASADNADSDVIRHAELAPVILHVLKKDEQTQSVCCARQGGERCPPCGSPPPSIAPARCRCYRRLPRYDEYPRP